MENYGSAKLGTVNFKKSKFVCRCCNRTLDDCVFVDESTKLFTPYCKTCRSMMNIESRYYKVKLLVGHEPTRPQDISVGGYSDSSAPKIEESLVVPTSASANATAPTSASASASPTSAPNQSAVVKVIPYPKFPAIHFSVVCGVIPCSNWAIVPSNQMPSTPVQATLIYHRSYRSD